MRKATKASFFTLWHRVAKQAWEAPLFGMKQAEVPKEFPATAFHLDIEGLYGFMRGGSLAGSESEES